ncbi:hypothetical protein AVV29_gp042 [Vibrio phage phi 3]|uniref:Uncharacterized protein n=1 Tax=Vibrio phage phi 3 TaxID=1589298 RepID=A0A0B5HE57_9CAUD|nr:hypothetical protein AVV29_gp042 [Vibrio phage phi 3]AJF40810.1 hypothetical protein SBVP3_0042 [Vibrio phage phi 3]
MAKQKDDVIVSEHDYSKEELVYTLALMLNLQDHSQELNKFTKPALWILFDQIKERGNAFASLEDELRKAQKELLDTRTKLVMAERKVRTMEKSRGKQKVR